MSTRVTKRQAEATLVKVKRMFKGFDTEKAQLFENYDRAGWAIVWEEGLPYEWTMFFPHGGIEEEFGFKFKAVEPVRGVFAEPYNGHVLGLFKD